MLPPPPPPPAPSRPASARCCRARRACLCRPPTSARSRMRPPPLAPLPGLQSFTVAGAAATAQDQAVRPRVWRRHRSRPRPGCWSRNCRPGRRRRRSRRRRRPHFRRWRLGCRPCRRRPRCRARRGPCCRSDNPRPVSTTARAAGPRRCAACPRCLRPCAVRVVGGEAAVVGVVAAVSPASAAARSAAEAEAVHADRAAQRQRAPPRRWRGRRRCGRPRRPRSGRS